MAGPRPPPPPAAAPPRRRPGGARGWAGRLALAAALLRPRAAGAVTSGSFFAGPRGSGPGRFRGPIGIAETPGGDLVIADTDNHRVQRCRPRGTAQGYCWVVAGNSTPGAAPNQVYFPYGVAVTSDDTLFVVDTFNNRVVRWEPGATEGITVMANNFTDVDNVTLGGGNEMNYPVALTIDEHRGHLYVVDTGNHRVRRYNISMTSKNVTSRGMTVAGTTGVFGPNLTQLDNPTGIALNQSDNSIWIADARNYRIVRWEEGATAGSVELDGMRGKPYGIFQTGKATYVSDSGACTVFKLLPNKVQVVVAGGNGCGNLASQLRFPSGLAVISDGTIYISDTQNNRIMRWYPTPRPVGDVLCYFNSFCGVVLRDGEPTEGNRLVIVNKTDDDEVACGSTCYDPRLDGANWSSVAHPEGDWISDMTYNFGVPSLGDYGQYYMCWGASPNMDEVLAGNCRGVPHVMGVLTVFPNVYPDENATRITSQCVKGGRCYVDIWGYAFPEGTVENPNIVKSKGTEALTPPASGPGSGVVCGEDDSANFVGYRDFVSVNPAQTVVFRRPWGNTGNLTSIATVDFNLALTIGRHSLCLCYDGNMCYKPSLYGSYGGTMLSRGTVGGESWVCRLEQNCSIQIQGMFLLESDVVGLVSWEAPCLNLLMSNISNVSLIAVPAGAPSDDYSVAYVHFGLFPRDGRYKVCYCATYEDSDDDNATCSSQSEYTQDAGALAVIRVLPRVYECPVSRPCVVTVYGIDLSANHRLQVGDGNPEVCGFAGVTPYSFLYGVEIRSNVFEPGPGGSESSQTFTLDTFTAASPRSACYCPDYDQQVPFITPPPVFRRLADGTCNDPIEFYQPVGPIVTRGPALSQPRCVMNRTCNVTVPGIDLSIEDKLQVCPRGHRCGEAAACPAAGPLAAAGLQRPSSAAPETADFALGAVPLGLYELCYCAPGNASSPSAIPCDAPADLTMQAVLLRVRGVHPEQRLSCVVENACTLVVQGLDVSSSDKLQVAPLNDTCGNASSAAEGVFLPSSNLNATPGGSSNLEQAFELALTTRVGRYRLCYCIEVNCTGVDDYYLDAGVLFVKGIKPRYHAARCTLGERCNFEIKGMGLVQGLDMVQLVPTYLGCGGSQVIVSGDSQAGRLDGIYDRGKTLFETRPWYQGRKGNQYLFYDLYSYRWVLGPERNPDVPETAGWAWVEDLFTQDTTPDRVVNSWQVWDQQAAWVDQPDLNVGRVTAPAGEIEENPCNTTTDLLPDPEIDFPFLVSERFELGIVSKLSSYLICYCPALDGDDKDEEACSGDDEFLVPNGMLLIEVVRGNERHHCVPHGPCLVRTVLPELIRGTPLRVLLLPADGRCNEGPFNTSAAWASAMNVTGRLLGTEATFDMGDASTVGSFQVCLCTGYDDSVDGVPCSEPHEFYQQIGTLTVMPTAYLSFEFGQEATLNLTRGLGLNTTDSLRFVEGESCTPAADAALTMRPDAVSIDGHWAAYVLGRENTSLPRGSYTACLCTAWDGGDAGAAPCDDSSEFSAKVAVVTVNVVISPELTSSVTSAVELEVQVEPSGEGRRLSSTSNATSLGPESVLGFAFASAVAEALRGAMTGVLGASVGAVSVPVELVDIVVLNTSVPLRVGLTAGFVARLTGTAEQHLRPVLPNVSCRASLLNAPWNNTGSTPKPTQAELQDCLWIGELLDDGSAPLLAALSSQLSGVAIPGIVSVSVLRFLHGDLAPGLAWEPLPSACIRGVPCDVPVASGAALLSGGALLMLDGADAPCGSLPPPSGVANASERAAVGFEENPAAAPVLAPPAGRQQVALGEPTHAGVFALCYCWSPAASPSACSLDWDFYQRAGTLTVRGAERDLEFPCTSFTQCAFVVRGTGLTAWDRVMVIPWTSHCGFSALALDRVEHNPALADRAVGFTNGTDFRRYQLGMITRIGKYRICYCASLAHSATIAGSLAMGPCAYAADFSMMGGTLWSRGVDSSSFRFSCVKDDINTTRCALMLAGQGLMPGADAVLLVPPTGAPCGAIPGELADVFDPNPIVVEAGGAMVPWHEGQATSAARWRVRAKRIGAYRVCFCPMSTGGSCSGSADFFHQAGLLTVRGAQGEEVFICRADDACFIRVHGLSLSMRDKVKVINGDQFCDWGGAGSDIVELNPAAAVEVSDDLGMAEFALGVVQPASARVVNVQPVTLRVCYCASNNIDGEGEPCSSGADFTHSAGIINTVVCPRPPSIVNFNPPVQDVFGDLGDPHIRLFSIPEYTCEDEESRTLEDLLLFSTELSHRGRTAFNDSRVLVTRDGQCKPNVPAGAPLMNMMASRSIEITVLGAMWNSGSTPRGGDIRIRLAHHLRGVVSVVDIRGQGHVCPYWEVNIVPLACDAPAATLFGLLLHGVILLASAIFVFSNQLGAIVRFIKDLRREAFGLTDPAPEATPRPGMPKAGQTGLGASATSVKATRSMTSALKSTSHSGQQPEEEKWDGSGLAPVLASSWWASAIAGMRVAVLLAHLISFTAFGQVPDALMLAGAPLLAVALVLLLQFVVLAKAAGLRGACVAVLCPKPYVPPSALGQAPEPGIGRFALPPLLHSAAAVAKLHLDLALPMLAQRHHCELWRVAVLLLIWIVVVQVICPLFSLLFNFMSPRRQVPAAVIPLALTVFGTLAGDEPMLGPEPLGLEPAANQENDSDIDSVLSRGSKRSIWSAGSRGLRRLTERLGFRSKDSRSSRSKSPISSNQPTPKGSKEPSAAAARGLRPVMNVRGEEDVANRKERERKTSLRKAAKQALADRVAKGRKNTSRMLVQSVPETGELEAQEDVEPEEEEDAGCCGLCSLGRDALTARFGWLSWVSMVVASPAAPALVEEMHRHRAVGLYAFMEASGWHVATAAAREVVERVSGVSVAHMQGRWTMLYSLFGGLDLTAIHAFVAVAYAPRLSEIETAVLIVAVLVGLFQASRPGTGQALLWLIELCINGPWSLVAALSTLAFLRVAGATPLSWGCPRFTWGFTAWACSVLLLEVPLFLLWRRYHSLPWGELRTKAIQATIVFIRELPGRLALCCCCCCCGRRASAKVAEAEETTKEAAAALALADAKPSKIAQVVPTPEYPEAEPLMAALKKLVETLPEGLKMVLEEEEDGDIKVLRDVVQDLFKLPPPKYDLEVRVKRLARTNSLLHSLALKLEDEDKHCRKAFNDVLRLTDEKLYRLRLAVDAVRLVRSIHYRLGSLENRAELAFEVLPDAPQMWLVHWATLLSLGRLPDSDESEHLVPAEEVAREFPGDVVIVPVIHRPRTEGHPDPHGVTCRQLVTFAKWYRSKWGLNLEIFYWLDCCCFPEIVEAEAEAARDREESERSVSRRSSKRSSTGSSAWSLPTSRNSSKSNYSDFSRGTRLSGLSRFSRMSNSSRLSRLSGNQGTTMRATVKKKGLKNLAAWMEDGSDTASVRSASSGLASINFRDRTSIIGGLSESAGTLMLKGRSSSKMRSSNYKTLSDLQRMKRDKDMGRTSVVSLARQSKMESPLYRLGLETVDVNRDMLQDGSDLVRLLVFAAADAVVLCETHDSEDSAWARLGLALAYAFSPTGQQIYAVDRSLVHVPSSRKAQSKPPEAPAFAPRTPIPRLSPPIADASFPAAPAALEDAPALPALGDARGAVTLVSAVAAPADTCVWREIVPEFMERLVMRKQDHFLADPTDWGEVHLASPREDRPRIVRLAALCLDRPTILSVGAYRRPPLEFGKSVVHICRLEVKNRAQHQWRRALRKQKLAGQVEKAVAKWQSSTPPESSSSSGSDNDDFMPKGDGEDVYRESDVHTKFRHQRPVLDLTERSWELYYKNKKEGDTAPAMKAKQKPAISMQAQSQSPERKKDSAAADLLRRAADMRSRWGNDSAPQQMLHPLPSLKKLEEMANDFHPSFHSRNILIGSSGRTAEQFRPRDSVTGKQQAGNPGLAVLSQPLKVRGAVCPDKYKARGVSFDLKVEATNPGWRDGLGIGFTAQDPDQWPPDKLKPRHASLLPRTCMCGYSGRWVLGGRSELVHSLNPGQGAWEPGSVRVGDVVTAVLAAPPADVVRILVNGRLVAERPALSSGLPDPSEAPLWGVVELDGACAKVRLGAGDAPRFASDLTEMATRARRAPGQ